MGNSAATADWRPVGRTERYAALDVLRGLALLGVLLVNLLNDFRVSLAEHLLAFHTHPGGLDRAADVFVAALLEFKAFTLFSLLFGVGLALFSERAVNHQVGAARFLLRRLLVLLGLGLCHMLLFWNGDILSLYAVCGLLLLPVLRLPTAGWQPWAQRSPFSLSLSRGREFGRPIRRCAAWLPKRNRSIPGEASGKSFCFTGARRGC
jgi:uncharacterized membrane protein YeiB